MNNELIYIILAIGIGVLLIIMAIISILNEKLSIAVIAAGVVSLFASILFLLMSAPDVAMTEAAIGSGLSTLIFFYVLNKIKKYND
jgi:uncharacterized MnhB-related membrane protein